MNNYIESPMKIKVYKKRWFILILYILYTAIGQFQWVEYSIIKNIVQKYYNVSYTTVDWTAMVFMLVYPIFVVPASYIIDKLGLRVAGLLGCLGTAAGIYLKLFSVHPNSIYLVIIGQTVVGVSQLLILSLPPKLAITWFAENEISTACSLGVFGMQLGCALGFIIPPTLVKDHDNLDDIGYDIKLMCWVLAIAITPVALGVLIYFPKEPKLPANNLRENEVFSVKAFFHSMIKLFLNGGFVIHMIAFSISVGSYTVLGSLLSAFVLEYFENAQEDAGRMGLVMIVAGIIGTPIVGYVLDKTHRFKESCFISGMLQAASVAVLIFALEKRMKLLVYLCFTILGMFLNTYIPAGIEFATELTYPSTESTTTGILYAMSQVLGFLATLVLSIVTETYGTLWALSIIMVTMIVGALMTFIIPNKLRRQASLKAKVPNGFSSIPQDDILKS
ncbi:uncharacterized MFS-type transporter C09D4.1 [Aethina tumida]|uniref:uncharacterized MFS-type transporter C09D4.1 n=1 Tax=Aethina tumida TaxID=116153 RepID=UPI0021489440|nr:uncharacterized MFS-type transporter C09D4.1 [Aethina tumida]XP_049820194.1 uncharacterized MFS-type transporter C09D4.1 [Aethina tumida]